jgi:hypothetical protein
MRSRPATSRRTGGSGPHSGPFTRLRSTRQHQRLQSTTCGHSSRSRHSTEDSFCANYFRRTEEALRNHEISSHEGHEKSCTTGRTERAFDAGRPAKGPPARLPRWGPQRRPSSAAIKPSDEQSTKPQRCSSDDWLAGSAAERRPRRMLTRAASQRTRIALRRESRMCFTQTVRFRSFP